MHLWRVFTFLLRCLCAERAKRSVSCVISRLLRDEMINFLTLLTPPVLRGKQRNITITMVATAPRLDLRCECVCEGEKRPIKNTHTHTVRGQVCSYCFFLSPWKPKRELLLNWCLTMNLVFVFVCVWECVWVCEGLWGKLKCQQDSIYDRTREGGWH